jgi:hypothetical protein
MKKTRVLTPVKCKIFSAEEFLKLAKKRGHLIESYRFIAPRIGKKGFGMVKVTFKDWELMDVG